MDGFDFILDDINNYIDIYLPDSSKSTKSDIHLEIAQSAKLCANGSVFIAEEWEKLLSLILNNWDVAINMDLQQAISYLMEVCGYDLEGNKIFSLDKSKFWFLQSEQFQDLKKDCSYRHSLYYITVAVFETINYWCWHDYPTPVLFDFKHLKEVLTNGIIHINWDSYLIEEESDVTISEVISPDIDDEEVDLPLECVYGPPSFYEEYENFMHDPYVRRYIEEREARKKRDR